MKEAPEVRGEVIAALVSSFDEPATGSRWRAMAGLACLDNDDRAVEALIAFATKGSGDLRVDAVDALGLLDGRPPRAVPVLVRALADEDEDIVYKAAMALREYADPRATEPLKEALVKAQKNPRWVYELLVLNLMEALAAAGAGRDDVVDVLTSNLSPPLNSNAGGAAFSALINMGAKAKRAIPALEAMTENDNLYLATKAHHALGAITGDYKSHLAALRAAKKSKDEGVQAAAEIALIAARK